MTAGPPDWLASRPHWLMWRLEPNPDLGGKPRKVPYYIPATSDPGAPFVRRHGELDTPEDRVRLVPYAAAVQACAELDAKHGFRPGLAIVDGLAFVDLDNIGGRDAIELGLSKHADILAAVDGAAIELSQSGTGAHIFGTTSERFTRASDGSGIEVYTGGHFCAYTGDWLRPPEPHARDLTPILAQLAPSRATRSISGSPEDVWGAVELLRATARLLALDPDCPRDVWLRVGMAIHAGTDGSEDGLRLWNDWSSNGLVDAAPPASYSPRDLLRDWGSFKPRADGVGPGTLFAMPSTREAPAALLAQINQAIAAAEFDAIPGEPAALTQPRLSALDFYLYAPEGNRYIFAPDGAMWNRTGVNKVLGDVAGPAGIVPAADFIDATQVAHQLTWAPGEPPLVRDRVMDVGGGWMPKPGTNCFNRYRAPRHRTGDPHGRAVALWREHVRALYGDDGLAYIVRWFAHRSQHPDVKLNHALVLGGRQGIGKDTIIEPLRYSVGAGNFAEQSAGDVTTRFNAPFASSVVLRISEVYDTGELSRQQFADHMKVYIAAPPDTLAVQDKYVKQYQILNRTAVLYTTNHKLNALWLTPEDRRHLVLWSDRTKEEFTGDYWNAVWGAYIRGGLDDLAAYLRLPELLAGFDPKAPPPKTAAWHAIVAAHQSHEDNELADVLAAIGRPAIVTMPELRDAALKHTGMSSELAALMADRGRSRIAATSLESAGYEYLPRHQAGKDVTDLRWSAGKVRLSLYARSDLTQSARIAAAREYCKRYGA